MRIAGDRNGSGDRPTAWEWSEESVSAYPGQKLAACPQVVARRKGLTRSIARIDRGRYNVKNDKWRNLMWFDPIMSWLLRSPLHRLISSSTMLVTYSGKKSGKTYTIPVNFFRDSEGLYTISLRNRTWWRNFRGGAPVVLLLQRRETAAEARLLDEVQQVAEILIKAVRVEPTYGRYLEIPLAENGLPDPAAAASAAAERVVVEFQMRS
jgi:deazaflavin-dependent oxidoreductase (nitroreductase family)